ncbi:MAG: hypothetical protein OJJ54_09935 [Pseudonocardia sp.]|nr:hypothetical protein [Pseudonocardia sp.]
MSAVSLPPRLARPGSRRAEAFAVSPLRASDLELFWPSRRGHAFDEFCR